MSLITDDINKLNIQMASKFLQAYLECSDGIQEVVREMLAIVNAPDADADDRDMAIHTLADALFPNQHEGKLGIDLEEAEAMGASHSSETAGILERFNREEENFAIRLRAAMDEKGITQEQLAASMGIGQPAISNMLNRQCRPQRRTVVRFAEALGVLPESLWPSLEQ